MQNLDSLQKLSWQYPQEGGDLAGIGLPDNIASQALLAGLHKVLGPFVIKTLGDAFSSAQRRNAVLATSAVQHDANFLFLIVLLTSVALDVTNDLF